MKLDAASVAVFQAEAILPLVARVLEAVVVEQPDSATEAEQLSALIKVSEAVIVLLSAFLTQWKNALNQKDKRKTQCITNQ
jgi:hypothetical protein